MTSQLEFNYQRILNQIHDACHSVQRHTQDIRLIAVSKKQSHDKIRALYHLGQSVFAENYVQEAMLKMQQLQDLTIEWHFIGHVQRNKTKLLAEHFAWVQGVDKLIIAERLSAQRLNHLPPLNICIQVNIDHQETKDGCHISEVPHLVSTISRLPNLKLRGLMVIPAPHHTQAFHAAKLLFDDMKQYHAFPQHWDTLSMGMSGDLEQAIQLGSTMIRIGTALFGERV